MTILKTNNLTKKYGKKHAVDSVSMTINQGDIYGLVGTNGAGKTTLMRLILTLATPTEGTIEIFESDNQIEACQRIGSLIETPSIYRGCTAYENLKRYSILYGGDESKIDEILELVGLADTGKKKAGQFSLGMTQRLGIAIALLGDPDFLVLDEPINGLDPVGISEIRSLIIKLNKEKGVTFLVSSHLLDELSKIATKIGIMNNGKLIQELTIEELQKESRRSIYIKTSDNEKAISIMGDKYDAKIEGEYIIVAEDITEEDATKCAEINRLLVTNGVDVCQLDTRGGSLEQFYIEKVGAANE